MEPSQSDPLVRAIKRLALAVWSLVVLSGVYVAIQLWAYMPYFGTYAPSTSAEVAASGPPRAVTEAFQQLHGLPPEEMIKRASVITISKHEVEAGRGKCVLSEILKHSPGVRFYYKVGDSFRHCSYDPTENASYGEGQVTFFVGNPADMRYATTYFGDRISGLGDMPFTELRALIAADQRATNR